MFVTSQGADKSVARFRRAIKTQNMLIIRAAAAELPHIALTDALEICLVLRTAEPARLEAAAIRWIARFCAERTEAQIDDVGEAALAFEVLRADPEAGQRRLQILLERVRR